ncbi:hypothetical protein GXB85_11450 [Cellulomonas sp. APG4]|uniref:hypothetical protein n=1 Tax=Cellulomonas sp. APG4 TaxID=1538656 RepID=UPI00137B632B|nr:hypothetical protein [Cellulomonas sp. APG4]NCT91563.1 hypothetical protein [Cellulomonas sp. APG4]
MDDAELDVHESAIGAANAVLARYWPEESVPLDAELLAARMGIDVVLGTPARDAAVVAVRDERGARVVIAAHLHPSVRSALLVRAIGHLSRPDVPAASENVTDAFTLSFRRALLVPEHVLDTLRRSGLSWPQIDAHLGVDRGTALEQWGLYAALWRTFQRTNVGGAQPPWRVAALRREPPRPRAVSPAERERRYLLESVAAAVRQVIARGGTTAVPRRPVPVDVELSAGVEAYLRRPLRVTSERRDDVGRVAVRRSPEQLLAEVTAVVAELGRIPLGAARGDYSAEIRLVGAHVDRRHPELSREARSALVNDWAFANR